MSYERARVLMAMVALDEFTVADLSQYADVGDNTVRTVVRRESRYLEDLGTAETGRRGGRPKRYRLRPGMADQALAELRDLDRRRQADEPVGHRHSPPESLLIAEDLLLTRILAYNREDSERALALAERQIEAAIREGAYPEAGTPTASRAVAAQWLAKLAGAELKGPPYAEAEVLEMEFRRAICVDIIDLVNTGQVEKTLLGQYLGRVVDTPVFEGRERWQICSPANPQYVLVAQKGSPSVAADVAEYFERKEVRYKTVDVDSTTSLLDGNPMPNLCLLTASDFSGADDRGSREYCDDLAISFSRLLRQLTEQSGWATDAVVVTRRHSPALSALASRCAARYLSLDDVGATYLGDAIFAPRTAAAFCSRPLWQGRDAHSVAHGT